jgi:AraC-like DNA-binding protein
MSKQAIGNDTTILSWVKHSSSAFYIGTYHSLYYYDGQQVSQLQNGLDKVRSMAYSEKLQTLYLLSKARGVCQWKDEQLKVLLDSTDFRQLHLQGDTALLLLKGVAGVRMLNLKTQQLTIDTTMADVKPIVTAYILDGEKRLMPCGKQRLILPKGTELVEISLSTLDFDHASQVQFAYRLNDDGEWMELPEGEHVIKFAHLPSGESQLQVRATDAYGRWSAPMTVLTLVRPATWYEHTWLWVFLVVALLVGGFYLIKRRREKEEPQEIHLQEAVVEEEPNKLPVADQEFLDKAIAAVSAHMTDSDYSVDALASDLCMSRANLHRKMRAINGQTPTDFIRNQRLERAAQLLRTTSHSVNEIADLVGFSYASYFTKCFKEKYGVLPKDY